MIVDFIDIDWIVDPHCLNFLLIEIYLFKHLRLIDSENLTLSTIYSTQTTENKKQIHSS